MLRPNGQDWFIANESQMKDSQPKYFKKPQSPVHAWQTSKNIEDKTVKQLPPLQNLPTSQQKYSATIESLLSSHLLPPIQKPKPLPRALTDRPELLQVHAKLGSNSPASIPNPVTLLRKIDYVPPNPINGITTNQIQVFEKKTVPGHTIINSPIRAQSPTQKETRKNYARKMKISRHLTTAASEMSLEEARLMQSLQRLEYICREQKERIKDLNQKSEHLEQEVTTLVQKSNTPKKVEKKKKKEKAFPIPSIALSNAPNGLPQPRARNRIKRPDSPVNAKPHPSYGKVKLNFN